VIHFILSKSNVLQKNCRDAAIKTLQNDNLEFQVERQKNTWKAWKNSYLLLIWELVFCFYVLNAKHYIAAWLKDYRLASGDCQIL